jgi:hypothetical protein
MEILLGIVAVVILLGCVATIIALIGVFMTVVMRVVGLPRRGRGAWFGEWLDRKLPANDIFGNPVVKRDRRGRP